MFFAVLRRSQIGNFSSVRKIAETEDGGDGGWLIPSPYSYYYISLSL
jgi:hypothetical protein